MNHSASINNNTLAEDKGQAFDQEVVEAFQSLFRGRIDVRGELYDESNPDDPKYVTKAELVTLEHYRDHLFGRRWLGILPLVGDKCRFAATDLDEKDFQKALAIRNALQEFGLKAYVAETKHKGYRILLFFDEPQLARDVRLVLKAANEKLQLSCEIFPKQDSLPLGSLKEGEIGSFVNLPYFKDRCPFLTVNNKPVPLEYALDHIKYNAEEHVRRALENIPHKNEELAPSQMLGHSSDEIVEMLSHTLAIGERRPTLVKLAGYLRYRGVPEEVALALLLPWAGKYFAESLPPEQVERHIRGVYRRYGVREGKPKKMQRGFQIV
jgi:hypothetical protein